MSTKNEKLQKLKKLTSRKNCLVELSQKKIGGVLDKHSKSFLSDNLFSTFHNYFYLKNLSDFFFKNI